jgi:PAS domain S-box-containing protein
MWLSGDKPMTGYSVTPTGRERFLREDEIIVTKTDLNGRITYANDVFLRIAGYAESEVLSKPHSMIRHLAMPRDVFALLWETIRAKQELFAYVKNMAKNGDHYWVLAHVTPTFGPGGHVVESYSNRRVADRRALERVEPLYARMTAEEARFPDKRSAVAASRALIDRELAAAGMNWDEFVWALASKSV